MNKQSWESTTHTLMNELKEGESLSLALAAEDSLFIRMTQARVRQSSEISQGFMEMSLFHKNRSIKVNFPFLFRDQEDIKKSLEMLDMCREKVSFLPEDPFLNLPQNYGSFHKHDDQKVARYSISSECLNYVQNTDFVGLLAAGEIVRANYNSAGLDQWFLCSNFFIDFSLYTQNQQAIKGFYGGKKWNIQNYQNIISEKLIQLDHLNHPLKTLEKGKYRTYFAPSAVMSLIQILSWRGVSQDAYQRGDCALKKLVDKECELSPLFSLQENFIAGDTPPFNEYGEISPEIIPLIIQGNSKNLLCSTRTEKEYHQVSNFANQTESLRSPEIEAGHISTDQILKELGTGLYVSHLHYLNWSDIQQGRITGMTRFGCFWIENGKIVSPVKDMRFDESLYHFWGTGLEGFTDKTETFPETGTYFQRNLGSIKTPGMIVNDFTYVS